VLVGEFFTFKTGIPGGPGWISRRWGLGPLASMFLKQG